MGANKPPTGRLRDVPTTKKQGFDGIWGFVGWRIVDGFVFSDSAWNHVYEIWRHQIIQKRDGLMG